MCFGKLHLTLSGEKIMCRQDFVAGCVDRQVVPKALAALQSGAMLQKKNYPGTKNYLQCMHCQHRFQESQPIKLK